MNVSNLNCVYNILYIYVTIFIPMNTKISAFAVYRANVGSKNT